MSSKYDGLLGFAGVPMVSDPRHNFTIVVGRSGEGKSSFVQSAEGLFIINVDLSSTTNKAPKAAIWPGVRSDGTPVEPNPSDLLNPEAGIPITLDWKAILEKRDLLVAMAKDGYEGRPTTVVLDTADLAYPMLQKWMGIEGGKEGDFSKLYGPDAWPESYQLMLDFVLSLRRVGYGVIYVMHLGDKTIHMGEMKKEYLRDQPMVKDNLWNLLKPQADMCVAIEKETSKQLIQKPILGMDGKPKLNPTTKAPLTTTSSEEVVRHVLTVETTKHQGVLKKRVEIPDRIILPETGGFAVYEAAYRLAAQSLPS